MNEFYFDANDAKEKLKNIQNRLALKIYHNNKEEITRINSAIDGKCNMLSNTLKVETSEALDDLFRYYRFKGFNTEIVDTEDIPYLKISW